jgi:DNA-binding transcriptional regulator YhcF (GntR family)
MSRINRNGAAFQLALDLHSGVPVYRQLIDQVRGGIASGSLTAGDQLPTVRQPGNQSQYRNARLP